jgi:hypothetical protein
MAHIIWESVKTIQCERIQDTASLLQERVYLGDSIANTGLGQFRVRAQRCSCDTTCNLRGCACLWSGLNSDVDPFEDARRAD